MSWTCVGRYISVADDLDSKSLSFLSLAPTTLKMAVTTCYNSTGDVAVGHTPCGWSSSLQSTLCCPDNYQCRANGLCTLPDSETVTSAQSHTYSSDPTYRYDAEWAQLPSCSSADWMSCGFELLGCCKSRPLGARVCMG